MKKILFWLFAVIYTILTYPFMILGFVYQLVIFEFVMGRDKSRKFIVSLNRFYNKIYDRES